MSCYSEETSSNSLLDLNHVDILPVALYSRINIKIAYSSRLRVLLRLYIVGSIIDVEGRSLWV